MVTATDVYELLSKQPVVESVSEELISACCEQGVNYVYSHLKENAEADEYLILVTAVAMAEFYLSGKKYSETDIYDTYSAGDLTFRRNCEREMKVAKEKMILALSDASEILKDGGFYCVGC